MNKKKQNFRIYFTESPLEGIWFLTQAGKGRRAKIDIFRGNLYGRWTSSLNFLSPQKTSKKFSGKSLKNS